MKKFLFILSFLILSLSGYANHFTIGTGSGTVSLTSMSGHAAGDTAFITAGTYTFGDFENLTGIIFMPLNTTVTFGGTISIVVSNDSLCQFLGNTIPGTTYGFVVNGSADGFQFSGHTYGMRVYNWDFENLTGNCFDLSSATVRYDGVNDYTLMLRNSSFVNIKANNCDEVMQGTFASIDSCFNMADSISFINPIITNLQGMGYAISYIGCFRLLVDGAIINGDMPGAHGDTGFFFLVGNCTLRNIRRNGGFGYILRICTASLHNTALSTYLYNIIDVNSYHYGTFDTRSATSFGGETYYGTKGLTGGDTYCLNVTSGNKKDTSVGPYTTVMGIVGNMTPFQCHMMNCFSYNTYQIQSGHNMLQVNTGENIDTANNVYWSTANGLLKDSTTTWMPLASPFLNLNSGGTNQSSVYTVDINNIPWGGVYGKGAVKYVAIIPSTGSGHIIRRKGYRVKMN